MLAPGVQSLTDLVEARQFEALNASSSILKSINKVTSEGHQGLV